VSRAPKSKVNPRHTGPLTPPGNHIPALFDQPALFGHPRCCAGINDTVPPTPIPPPCRPLKRGRRHPRKGYGHLLCTRQGQRCGVRPAGHVSPVTSGPVWPSPPLCCHPRHCSVTPNIVGDIATPAVVWPLIFRRLSPRTGVRTTTKQELQRYYPRSRAWTGTGFTTTPARGKIRQDDCQFHDIVRHAAACST
jgi:hypothetical protein